MPKFKTDASEQELPLTFSQLLYYIQQTNYKTLWKDAHKKYSSESSQDNKCQTTASSSTKTENVSGNLIPYELVLREAIIRMYGCQVIHFKLDRLRSDSSSDETPTSPLDADTQNPNHFPFLGAVESNTHFYLIYNPLLENSLLDCIAYSPAMLDKNYNKPLFIVYQLLNLLKSIHEKGLLLGEIATSDIFMTENLLLHVIPRIESNLIAYEFEEMTNAPDPSAPASLLFNPLQTLKDYCQLWCTGQISNFDYLTILNNFAGRRIDSADYHHIVPWVIDFSSKNGNWRDMTKTKYRLTKGDAQLDLTFQHNKHGSDTTTSHHVSDVLSEITFYVYMARKTPKSVLCRHVRAKFVAAEYPASIKRLQEWTPDGEF